MPPPERHVANQRYDLVRALQELFVRLQTSRESSVNPRDFVQAAGVNAALQQDAQEFQVLFLNWLDQVLAETPGEEKLQKLFKGRLRSTIT